MAAAALFMSGFPSAMPRMGEVLGLSLMLCEWECCDFVMSCFASSWEAGNMKINSVYKGKRGPLVSQSDCVLQKNIQMIFKAVIFLFSKGITCHKKSCLSA